nr:acetylxylan esterase [bacterium]
MSLDKSLNKQLRSLNPNIFSSDKRKFLRQMLRNDVQARCKAVKQQDREVWSKIKSKDDWEKFCAPRIEALRQSLGIFPRVPPNLNVHVMYTIEGDGYRIENLVYESRAGVYVTANLYLPSSPHENPALERSEGIPAIIIVHSHHNPKTQGELQDMGMTWAQQGCMVLVMDQLSYGERRQHSPGPRQDYRFRYINGIQLHLIGDSLMGWMVWDVMRGVDLLLSRKNIDREKIILIGAVAGGGDPAAVTAAIDPRITCVIPFNFGGPQPETQYPLPDDAEEKFNYMGGAYWESTRNLRLSGHIGNTDSQSEDVNGFLHWVIVGSAAPRRLIYAHEFSWDKEHDPVWKRLQKVFGFYDVSDNIDFTHGAGVLSGRPPEATHCNNVGAVHRERIYSALRGWFDIPIPQEYQNRLQDKELKCMSSELTEKLKPRPLHDLFGEIGESRAAVIRESLTGLTPDEKRRCLCQEWSELLGDIEPKAELSVKLCTHQNL